MYSRDEKLEFPAQLYRDLEDWLKNNSDIEFSFGEANEVETGFLPCIFVVYDGVDTQHNHLASIVIVSHTETVYHGNSTQTATVINAFQDFHYAIPIRAQAFHNTQFTERGRRCTGVIVYTRET